MAKKRNLPSVSSLLLCIAVFWLGLVVIVCSVRDRALVEALSCDGIPVAAHVCARRARQTYFGGSALDYSYRYSVAGREYVAAFEPVRRMAFGASVPVRYLPSNPAISLPDGETSAFDAGVLAARLCCGAALAALALLHLFVQLRQVLRWAPVRIATPASSARLAGL